MIYHDDSEYVMGPPKEVFSEWTLIGETEEDDILCLSGIKFNNNLHLNLGLDEIGSTFSIWVREVKKEISNTIIIEDVFYNCTFSEMTGDLAPSGKILNNYKLEIVKVFYNFKNVFDFIDNVTVDNINIDQLRRDIKISKLV